MRLRRGLLVILLAGMLLPFCCGCMDPTSLDQLGYVLGVGVDRGEQKKFNVSFLLQKVGDSQEAMTGAGPYIITAEGDSLFDALNIANLSVPYQLSFTRMNFIMFSDQIASSALMSEFLSVSFNSINVRQSMKMLVISGVCADFLAGLASPDIPNVAKQQYGSLMTYQEEGVVPMASFTIYQEAVGSGWFDIAVPVGKIDRTIAVETGGSDSNKQQSSTTETNEQSTTEGVKRTGGLRSYIVGSALFDGNRLAGILNDQDTEMLLLVMGEYENGYITISDETGTITFLMKCTEPPRIRMALGDAPHAAVEAELYAEIQLDTGGNAEDRWDGEVKEQLETYLEQELLRVFERCHELNSDAMRFGRHACKQFSDIDAWRDYAWKEKYRYMTAEFSVTVELNNRNVSAHME